MAGFDRLSFWHRSRRGERRQPQIGFASGSLQTRLMKYGYIAKSLLKHVWSGFKLPYMVMFETTLMCNMFCEYCIFGEEGKFNDLQTRAVRDRIFRRIDEFCDMGIFALSFSGGEPLLNPNTCDYIAYAADKGMWTSMPTNGLLIKKYADGVARLDR